MTETHSFTSDSQARAFWHHLLNQMGFDRFAELCRISKNGSVITITIQR